MDSEPASILLQVQDWLLRRLPSLGVRRALPVSAALGSDVGAVRKENEDRVAIARGRDSRGHAYVVVALADGIGGMRAGGQCASLAVGATFDAVHRLASSGASPPEWVTGAVNSAHRTVRKAYSGTGGATLVVLLLTEKQGTYWSSVGDSRLYVSAESTLLQISTDDTIAGQLGLPASADIDQVKLLQYIGMEEPVQFEVSKLLCDSSNFAILTTDGVHFLASDSDVMSLVIRHSPDIGTMARRLTELARWAGGPDNATVAILSLDTSLHDPLPLYPCLEIWDPFGEIRIPLIPRKGMRATESWIVSPSILAARIDTPAKSEAAVAQPDAENDETEIKTKGRKHKKRKPRLQRSEPVPQVQIEFSNKKK